MSRILHYQSPPWFCLPFGYTLHLAPLPPGAIVIPVQGVKISVQDKAVFLLTQSAICLDTATTGSYATSTDDQQSPKEKGSCSIPREGRAKKKKNRGGGVQTKSAETATAKTTLSILQDASVASAGSCPPSSLSSLFSRPNFSFCISSCQGLCPTPRCIRADGPACQPSWALPAHLRRGFHRRRWCHVALVVDEMADLPIPFVKMPYGFVPCKRQSASGKALGQTVVCMAIVGGPLTGPKDAPRTSAVGDGRSRLREANGSRSLRLIRCRARLKELALVAPSFSTRFRRGSQGFVLMLLMLFEHCTRTA